MGFTTYLFRRIPDIVEEEDEEVIIERRRKQRELMMAKQTQQLPLQGSQSAAKKVVSHAPPSKSQSPVPHAAEPVSRVSPLRSNIPRSPDDSMDGMSISDEEDDFEVGLKRKLSLIKPADLTTGGTEARDQELAAQMDRDPDLSKRIPKAVAPAAGLSPNKRQNVDIFSDTDIFADDFQVKQKGISIIFSGDSDLYQMSLLFHSLEFRRSRSECPPRDEGGQLGLGWQLGWRRGILP